MLIYNRMISAGRLPQLFYWFVVKLLTAGLFWDPIKCVIILYVLFIKCLHEYCLCAVWFVYMLLLHANVPNITFFCLSYSDIQRHDKTFLLLILVHFTPLVSAAVLLLQLQ